MRLPCSYLAHLVIMSLLPFVKVHAGGRILFRAKSTEREGQMISWITLRFDPAAISGRLSGAAKHTRYSGPSFSSILGWAGVQISANKFLGFFLEFWILRNSSFRWRRSYIASWGGAGVQISANEFCFFFYRDLRNSSFRRKLSDKAKPTQDSPLLHLWTGVQISADKFWNFWECCFFGKLSGTAKHTQDPPPFPPLDRWTNICRQSLLSDCKTNVFFFAFWFHIVSTFPTIMLLERSTNICRKHLDICK